MLTQDQAQIAAQRLSPRSVELWRALRPLQTTVSFMNSGAHPDDEISGMLAALSWRDGVELSVACANRGEGGQNDIGLEATEALGTLRTAEMEQAALVLPLRLYWLSETPDDPIFDFGFSKSGDETFAIWGRDRTLRRFVQIVRQEKPDILCPTFLDVPGQHGHHRAMTQAAHEVFDLAADPGFAPELGAPWEIAKLYLPAWSGAGQAYDDDLPPPDATLTVPAAGSDPVTGWDYAQIGQQSRACHRTQAMGRWIPSGDGNDYPLHLAKSRVSGPDATLTDGLAARLDQLDTGAPAALIAAQTHVDAVLASYPDRAAILATATEALGALRQAQGALNPPRTSHRIDRKIAQISTVIRIAAGAETRARCETLRLRPGELSAVHLESHSDLAKVHVSPALDVDWISEGDRIGPGASALPSEAYPSIFLPDSPACPALRVVTTVDGMQSETRVALEQTPLVLPSRSVNLSMEREVLNRASGRRSFDLRLTEIAPGEACPGVKLPVGWQARRTASGLRITAPDTVAEGLYSLPVTLDGAAAMQTRIIAHDHVAARLLARPAVVQVRVLDTRLHPAKIGYIGGGNDRVDHWLGRIGADVRTVTDTDLASDAALDAFGSIVIGIFALRFRAGLADALPRLHRWVERGGTLVTLYHRPWDNWNPVTTAPRPLEIGQPSLRWRVTDASARVTHLAPTHPCLTTPNRIGPADWDEWHKERGLYFAKSWDAAYTPLLSMADPGEAPHQGALLAADIGAGRHIHCALILHHQMEKLTPGAFALMMNLTAPRG